MTLKETYINEIVAWNEKINLTGLKNYEDIKIKLYDDSLNISKAVDLTKALKIIDIGCGAGLPGLPLKIEYPQLDLVLVDSVAKKMDFVKNTIKILGLNNTKGVCTRAEALGLDNTFREKFDVAISRAVARLNIICEYCLPFVKVGGLFIAQKGPNIEGELAEADNAIKLLGGKFKEKIQVPSGFVIVIEKVATTSKEYPRQIGIPAKNPL